jgi:hypothetical protein
MAADEASVLKERGLSYVLLAEFLGVTRQSIARGIEAATPYLDRNKAAAIFARLQIDNSPEEATAFKKDCIERLSIPVQAFDEVPTSASRDRLMDGRGPTFNAEEIWVFTSRPREIFLPGYLDSIAARVYRISPASDVKRMIFFVPSEVCRTLRNAISGALRSITNVEERIHIQIIECDSVRFSPHYIVLNPRKDSVEGKVAAETEDRFLALPRNILECIIENIIKYGFDILGTGPDRTSDMAGFSIYFDSKEDM